MAKRKRETTFDLSKEQTNVELAQEIGCTARQVSKSRRRGYITWDDGREEYTAPGPHVDPRNYAEQQNRRAAAARVAAAKAAAEKAKADAAVEALLDD